MRTLLADRYAPITARIGFVESPFDDTTELLMAWRRGLGKEPKLTTFVDSGLAALQHLEPLTIPGTPRELLVEVGRWTAYFDNGLYGTDPIGPVLYLTRVAAVRGLAIATIPESGRRMGSTKWELFADHRTHFLNYLRSIALVHDDSGWVFETAGAVLPFEHADRYEARSVRDRFDSQLVEEYSRAIGIDPFNPSAYGPRMALVETTPLPKSIDVISMTLREAQADQGIVSGGAESLPG